MKKLVVKPDAEMTFLNLPTKESIRKKVVSQHVRQNKIEKHFFFAYSFCGSLGLTTNLSLSTFFRIDSFVKTMSNQWI
jgi:hypothetical protein